MTLNRHLKNVLNTPGAKKARSKRDYYKHKYSQFWNFEKIVIIYLILCALLFIFNVFTKLSGIGNVMVLLAGLGTGLFFLLIPLIFIFRFQYKRWLKKLNNILDWHHLNRYKNKI